jgi:hypothetical protein
MLPFKRLLFCAALNVVCRRINLLHTGTKVELHEDSRKTVLEFRFLGLP